MKISSTGVQKLFSALIISVLFLLIVAGAHFYDLFGTEISIVVLLLIFFFWLLVNKFKLKNMYVPGFALLWLLLLYLGISAFLGRDLYYFARQGVLVLYFAFFLATLTIYINTKNLFFDSFMKKLSLLAMVGTLSFFIWGWVVGDTPNTAFVFWCWVMRF